MDFVLFFTIYFAHRVFLYLIKSSFRPIKHRGAPASPVSSVALDFVPTAILIGKTQYFMKVDFDVLMFFK